MLEKDIKHYRAVANRYIDLLEIENQHRPEKKQLGPTVIAKVLKAIDTNEMPLPYKGVRETSSGIENTSEAKGSEITTPLEPNVGMLTQILRAADSIGKGALPPPLREKVQDIANLLIHTELYVKDPRDCKDFQLIVHEEIKKRIAHLEKKVFHKRPTEDENICHLMELFNLSSQDIAKAPAEKLALLGEKADWLFDFAKSRDLSTHVLYHFVLGLKIGEEFEKNLDTVLGLAGCLGISSEEIASLSHKKLQFLSENAVEILEFAKKYPIDPRLLYKLVGALEDQKADFETALDAVGGLLDELDPLPKNMVGLAPEKLKFLAESAEWFTDFMGTHPDGSQLVRDFISERSPDHGAQETLTAVWNVIHDLDFCFEDLEVIPIKHFPFLAERIDWLAHFMETHPMDPELLCKLIAKLKPQEGFEKALTALWDFAEGLESRLSTVEERIMRLYELGSPDFEIIAYTDKKHAMLFYDDAKICASSKAMKTLVEKCHTSYQILLQLAEENRKVFDLIIRYYSTVKTYCKLGVRFSDLAGLTADQLSFLLKNSASLKLFTGLIRDQDPKVVFLRVVKMLETHTKRGKIDPEEYPEILKSMENLKLPGRR